MSQSLRKITVAGFEALELQSPRLRAVIIPSLGGRVWELTDRVHNRQWIWHRHDVPLSQAAPDAVYDLVWAGGWEELFPNDAPGEFEGQMLLDHGEWWSRAWTVAEEIVGPSPRVRLVTPPIRGASCSKEFGLTPDGTGIEVRYRIVNQSAEAFHFLFKQHLPVALTDGCRLRLPGGQVSAVDPSFGSGFRVPGEFAWPNGGGAVDLSVMPPRSSGKQEFVYVREVPDGWCGMDDVAAGASLRMHYDRTQFPYVWFFMTFGGWQGCHTAVLEPCTNMPKDLSTAVARGQSAHLPVGGTFDTTVTVTLGDLGARAS